MAKRSNGEGSLTQRKDGRWQGSIQVDGKRTCVYGKTRREAYLKLQRLRVCLLPGVPIPNAPRITVNQLLDRWLEAIAPNLKPATIAQYRTVIDKHIRPAFGKTYIGRLLPAGVQALYAAIQDSGRRRTAELAHYYLHQALALAVRWRWLSENPCDLVTRPAHAPVRKLLWDKAQMRRFQEGTEGHWLAPLWTVALASGCRLGELLALSWSDLNWERSDISISKTGQYLQGAWVIGSPKSRAALRSVALPERGMSALRDQLEQQGAWRCECRHWADSGLVFSGRTGLPLHRATVDHAIRRECRRLAIPEVTPHGLRHMHASLLLGAALPVPNISARLGHAHSGITMAIYAHALRRDEGDVVRAIETVLVDGSDAR